MNLPEETAARRAWFQESCQRLHRELQAVSDGAVADYIPQLAVARPEAFAIGAAALDGSCVGVGDQEETFTVQSISKLLMYGLALETHGRAAVLARAGVAPTGDPFNAIELDEKNNRAPNPMVNAGAIAITDLVPGDSREARVERMTATFEAYLGRRPTIDRAVWSSEHATGHRNRALAYLMLSMGIIQDRVEETLDLYFAQCSVKVTVMDLALIGATLANGGVQPLTGRRVLSSEYVLDVLTVALTCGMYNYAGEWAYSIGIPAKSGVGGGIVGILPGQAGLAVWSPPLDEYGNSVRGVKVFEALSRQYGLHMFAHRDPWARSEQ